MKKIFIIFIIFLSSSIFASNKTLLLATTTSTDNTGLLNYLAPKFKQDTGITLKWVAVGTGEALELGKNCDADVLLVHAPQAEEKYVAQGYGIDRKQVMYNQFVIIGPKNDPAKIKGVTAPQALKTIIAKHALFISRGDNSGTNKKEEQLWQQAKITPPATAKYYLESGQGMLATIRIAAAKHGYTLTDTGTYVKYEASLKGKPPLLVLVHGGKNLRNQYSVILVNPKRCPKVKTELATQFSDWLITPKTQTTIAAYKLLGKKLFTPNANQ